MRELLEKTLHIAEQLHSLEWGFIDLSGKKIGTNEDHADYAREYFEKHKISVPKYPNEAVAKFLKLTGCIRYFVERDETGFTIATSVSSTQLSVIKKMAFDGGAIYFDIVDGKGDVLFAGKKLSNLISTLKNMNLLKEMVMNELDVKKALRTAAVTTAIGGAALGLGLQRGRTSKEVEKPVITAVAEEPSEWQTVKMHVTAYCPCPKCTGTDSPGITASGHKIQSGDVFVAADKRYSFGTEMIIPGYNDNQPVEVLDRGGAIKGNRIDVFFPTHEEALEWGVKDLDVKIYSD